MDIQITENEPCRLTVQYSCGKDEIDAKRTEVLNTFKNAPVKNFRSKAPIDAIRIQYSKQINDSLKRAMAEHAFHETLFAKNIKPLGSPSFSDIMLLDHKFSCSFSFNSKPTFELAPYKEMTIPKQPIKQSIEDLTQQFLQELRIRFGETIPYSDTDTVSTGDVLVVDYKAFDGEKELDAISGSGEVLTVGKIGLPGFDAALIGMSVDETKTFTISISEGGLPSLVGKDIRFELKLIMGSKTAPMPLNDELALKIGKETYSELLEVVSMTASMRHGEMNREAHIKQVSAHLLADNDIKVPAWLALSEAQYLAAAAKLAWETLQEIDQKRFLDTAEDNVKLALILDAIREAEIEAQLSDNEVLEMLRRQFISNGQDPEQGLAGLNQSGQLAVLTSRIRDEYTLDFILKSAVINQ